MKLLKKEIARQMKGALQEREDWWRLCYEAESRDFFIEHEWHHMNAYKLETAADEGTEVMSVDGYSGKGTDKIEEAKAALLIEAGHA